jgi:integrase
LSWHRFRHTWAEGWAEEHYGEPDAKEKLMYLGGWTNEDSPRHYIQHAIQKRANAEIRARNARMYNSPEELPENEPRFG